MPSTGVNIKFCDRYRGISASHSLISLGVKYTSPVDKLRSLESIHSREQFPHKAGMGFGAPAS